MYLLIVLIILMIVAGAFLKRYSPEMFLTKENESPYKYKKKEFFMSRAEHEFFDILVEVVGSQYYVFPQVHLPTILDYKIVGQSWRGAFRHIDEKSVDFVICDKSYIKPLLAIELDDKTHEREDRKERDINVEQIFKDAGLLLLRFENHGYFDKELIKKEIEKRFK